MVHALSLSPPAAHSRRAAVVPALGALLAAAALPAQAALPAPST